MVATYADWQIACHGKPTFFSNALAQFDMTPSGEKFQAQRRVAPPATGRSQQLIE